MVILLAGRQGVIGGVTEALTGERLVFAYSLAGLTLGYLYFSLPRCIATVMAAAEDSTPRSRKRRAAWVRGRGAWCGT